MVAKFHFDREQILDAASRRTTTSQFKSKFEKDLRSGGAAVASPTTQATPSSNTERAKSESDEALASFVGFGTHAVARMDSDLSLADLDALRANGLLQTDTAIVFIAIVVAFAVAPRRPDPVVTAGGGGQPEKASLPAAKGTSSGSATGRP